MAGAHGKGSLSPHGRHEAIKERKVSRYQWLMPVVLTTWEAEIRKIEVQDQPGQIAHKTPSPKT
jgi:hypothetical protein